MLVACYPANIWAENVLNTSSYCINSNRSPMKFRSRWIWSRVGESFADNCGALLFPGVTLTQLGLSLTPPKVAELRAELKPRPRNWFNEPSPQTTALLLGLQSSLWNWNKLILIWLMPLVRCSLFSRVTIWFKNAFVPNEGKFASKNDSPRSSKRSSRGSDEKSSSPNMITLSAKRYP